MLTANKNREKTKRTVRALNDLLREYDEVTKIACKECDVTYMRHDDNLYTIEQPTAFSKTPSLNGPGVFGAGTNLTQKRANGMPLV